MAHQVLVGHNGPTACLQNTEQNTTTCLTQTTNRVPQNCWNYLTIIVSFENGKNHSIQFEVSNNGPVF